MEDCINKHHPTHVYTCCLRFHKFRNLKTFGKRNMFPCITFELYSTASLAVMPSASWIACQNL